MRVLSSASSYLLPILAPLVVLFAVTNPTGLSWPLIIIGVIAIIVLAAIAAHFADWEEWRRKRLREMWWFWTISGLSGGLVLAVWVTSLRSGPEIEEWLLASDDTTIKALVPGEMFQE